MLDIDFIREQTKETEKACRAKNCDPQVVSRILKVDQTRCQLITEIESWRQKRNRLSKAQFKESKKIKEMLRRLEPDLRAVEEQYLNLLYQVPNLPAKDVPLGKDESQNQVIRKQGKPTTFSFPPRDYHDLGEALGIIDVARAAKVSGSRFGYLKEAAVLLEFALVQSAFSLLLKEGFIPIIPPVLIKDQAMRGMGYLEHGGDQETYHFEKNGLYLIGTSEQAIGPMHINEIFSEKDLPRRYLGFSTCFRREAGSYGKDTRGIFRVHQFDKLEMFSFVKPENSDKEHEYLLSLEEKLVQGLKLPYQVVKMCTGDLGHPTARKYDIECWFPSQKKYRETHSVSTCTDYQARRLNIRYRQGGKSEFVHTVNGTAFAIGRTILAILENYQQKDGSVSIPKVLQPYFGRNKIGPAGKMSS